MCIAVPGKLLSIEDNTAEVNFNGVRRKVALDLVPQAKKGDYVLVHAGFAITVLESSEAEKTLELFEEIYGHESPEKPEKL
ncbi:MAG: hydrogenase assembly protein HypC [Elusimicrobia bacterium GWA2_56_46]|nr:MAG: hydrogenase assembly protein HypC [Elusimicrobia bacterium GWA2_56_46]OGR53921.1 MAG: hydrogenase assembly protein HypC [Elusimicrobia bacterium GWC2_56_31]HBB68293.1 HypC/HybG/HupF family hydrogenase formation chaperone [Elusimicrobiota bacterium]HBW23206.1 HypC/HybG/HupF family hydrogenase formation chaperone [Elusimicrobiota bacterium]